jgi:hypothetical protein
MRPLVFTGILLAGLGAIVILRGGSFASPDHMVMMGDLTAAAGPLRTIPPWVGGLGLLMGGLLIMTGARRQR